MQETDKPRFLALFLEMQSCYPNAPADEMRAPAYWSKLKQFPLASVRVAMVRAAGESQEFLPTAVKIAEHAKAAEKSVGANPNYELRAIAGESQKLHGLPPDNPFEQLARRWERENMAGNPDCSKRAAELTKLLEGAKGPLAHDLVPAYRDWKAAAAGEGEEAA